MEIINRLQKECAIRGAEEVPVNKNGIKPRMLGQRSHNSGYAVRAEYRPLPNCPTLRFGQLRIAANVTQHNKTSKHIE